MTKQRTNPQTSVPPFRHRLARWRPIPIPRPKRHTQSYEDELQIWFDSWDPLFEGVALKGYKDGKALVQETKIGGSTIQEFRRQTISEEMRLELLDWATRTAVDCDWILRRLFDRYGISPMAVLDLLGSWKTYLVRYKAVIEASAYVRSEKRRKQHSKTLIKAAEILKLRKQLFPYAFSMPRYPESADLETIAKTLREFGAAEAYSPGKVEIKACARELSRLFRGLTRRPLPEYVGEIMLIAFPDKWNPSGDLKEAAKSLLKEHKSSNT